MSTVSQRPDVSIGLPVYNGEQYLALALDSLLAQEHRNYELIISDNASTDNTQSICERYAKRDARIRYHRNDHNRGWRPNFARVIELSTADYFMWASDDDTWSPNYIEALLHGFSRSANVVLSAGRTVYVTADGAPHAERPAHAPPGNVVPPVELTARLLDQHATSWIYGVYRRSFLHAAFERLQGFPDWGGDVLFLLECCLHHEVVGDDQAIIYKRVHRSSSLRPTSAWARTKWQITFTTHLLEQIAKAPLPWSERAVLLDQVRRYIWFIVINQGRRRTPRKAIRDLYYYTRGLL